MKNFFACMLRTFKDSIESIICLLCKHIMALYKLFILVNVFAMQVANHYNVEAMSRCLFLLVTGFFVLSVMSMAGCAQPIPSGACTKKNRCYTRQRIESNDGLFNKTSHLHRL